MAPAPTSSSSGCRSGAPWRDLYTTEVVAVGALVEEFVQAGVLVLFGEQAPTELHEFSVLHRPSVAEEGPAVGDIVDIDGTELPVLAVGEVVAGNLLNIGHLDLKADGNTEPAMPGDLCVPQGSLPHIAVGQTIRIRRPVMATDDALEGARL